MQEIETKPAELDTLRPSSHPAASTPRFLFRAMVISCSTELLKASMEYGVLRTGNKLLRVYGSYSIHDVRIEGHGHDGEGVRTGCASILREYDQRVSCCSLLLSYSSSSSSPPPHPLDCIFTRRPKAKPQPLRCDKLILILSCLSLLGIQT